jgi:Fe-S-cluster containining protein
MMEKDGFNFNFNPQSCEVCEAQCCSGESGSILFSKGELRDMAKFLNISEETFLRDFCRKEGYRYSIKEIKQSGNYNCIFLTGNRCDIYEVRPTQCRTFPFWDQFKNGKDFKYLQKECIGVSPKT